MWTAIKNWFRRVFFTEWQHVGLFERTMRYKHNVWTLYIHCFESEHGGRKIKVVGARETANSAEVYDEEEFEGKFKISPLYQKEIYPWLCGRAHTEIPDFKSIKSMKSDFVRKLKDKDTIVLEVDENEDA